MKKRLRSKDHVKTPISFIARLPPLVAVFLPVAGDRAIARARTRPGVVNSIDQSLPCLGHRARVQIVEMNSGQLRRIMALDAGKSLIVDMPVVLTAAGTVENPGLYS